MLGPILDRNAILCSLLLTSPLPVYREPGDIYLAQIKSGNQLLNLT